MPALHPWERSLEQILIGPGVSAEELVSAQATMKPILFWRMHPDLALHFLSGIVSVPTQRLMIYQANQGAPENHFACSRGTSKTATIDGQFATIKSTLYEKRRGVQLSVAGFRGSQLNFTDVEKWLRGGWDSQKPGFSFLLAGVKVGTTSKSIIHRAANYWMLSLQNNSFQMALPSKDPEFIRGIRAHDLYVDETNITENDELIERVAKNFLNVLGDFEGGGANAEPNCCYYTTTVDYGWRPYLKSLKAARDGLQRDFDAYHARKRGDLVLYKELESRGLLQYTLCQFDYSDTIIRRVVPDRNGQRWKINWPNPKLRWRHDPRGVPFTERDKDGVIKKDSHPQEILTTYPINKEGIERQLFDGVSEESMWLSEQRNVIDTAAGDVYPHGILSKMSFEADRYLIHYDKCSATWQQEHAVDRMSYAPTVMYRCTDPCVLGVDYAGGERDFCAYCVIRVGPLGEGEFDPTTGCGKTPWSNVIWCEQHRLTSHLAAADKIRSFRERYNLAYFYNPIEKDTWQAVRAIGLDMRGGGSGVRDELVRINDRELEPGEVRIYDPLDTDPRIEAFAKDPASIPMLDAIMPSDVLNERCVEYTLAELKSGRLYLPKWVDLSLRPNEKELDVAYNASKMLVHQLRKIQQEHTQRARRFYMKGNRELVENKKDLFSAWLYAAKQLRAHLIRQNQIDNAPPPMGLLVVGGGGRRSTRRNIYGRTPGTRGF